MAVIIGLDIGGTKFMAAAASQEGKILQQMTQPSPEPLEEGLRLLHEMILTVSGGEEIAGIGASVGGQLDYKTGIVSPLHQPTWRSVPLKMIMEQKWHAPFRIEVDTDAAVLGEYVFGKEKPSRLLYLTLSTGLGGGFMLDGKIYRGIQDAHPEAGHISIPFRCQNPERVRCACGTDDCLEALISGRGIERIYQKKAENLDNNEWEEVGYNLGQGLRSMAALYAPNVIALGGGVAVGAGEKLLRPARLLLAEKLKLVPLPQVRLSVLEYDTALYGALALAQIAAGFRLDAADCR